VIAAGETPDVLQSFEGQWGCSFTSPISALGPLAGIARFSVDSTGHVVGVQVVANATPHVVLEATIEGDFEALEDGTILGTLTATFPNVPPRAGITRCVGMDRNRDGQFREIHCVDVDDEPSFTINHTVCKRQ
jgi:hypothetical protein